MNTKHYLDVCRKLHKADKVLKNARIINVFTREIVEGDVAICDNRIIGIGDYTGKEEVDLKGKYIVPGFIDSHIHIESSMISPCEFAKVVVPFGTTTLIADPHEIANVSGLAGIEYMIKESEGALNHIYYMIPSCVPATNMESSGAILDADKVQVLMDHPRVLGLGEVMNYPGVILGDESVLKKIEVAGTKKVDGHAPYLKGQDLIAYAFAGVHTDHECSSIDEVLERLRVGMTVQIRKGSAANNLHDIITGLVEYKLPLHHCIFCTDDKHLEHIFEDGHINSNIRESIALGIDPVDAICMATLYPARTYGLNHKGAIAPGYDADLVILKNLEKVEVEAVMVNGEWAFADHLPVDTLSLSKKSRFVDAPTIFSTMHCDPVTLSDLQLSLKGDKAHIIQLMDYQILTKKVIEEVPVQNGLFKANKTYSKIAVFERHHHTGNKAVAILKNFNIQGGAIAQTIAHDSHNIVCVGDSDEDMMLAINTLIEKQGGIVVVKDGKVADHLTLPIAGLMSTLSAKQVTDQLAELLKVAKTLEINPHIDPFLTLAFLALPVIPDIKLTDRGLFDVCQFKHIPIDAQ